MLNDGGVLRVQQEHHPRLLYLLSALKQVKEESLAVQTVKHAPYFLRGKVAALHTLIRRLHFCSSFGII